jgi:hypothetical protein
MTRAVAGFVVILSEAKEPKDRHGLLRFAQDDSAALSAP